MGWGLPMLARLLSFVVVSRVRRRTYPVPVRCGVLCTQSIPQRRGAALGIAHQLMR